MFSRIISTAVLLLLSCGAFLAQACLATASDGRAFVVLGFFWLGLAVVNWFIWQALRDGWIYGRSGPADDRDLPLTGWFWPQYFKSAFHILDPPEPDRRRPAPDNEADR